MPAVSEHFRSLCANMTLSIKPEVHNVSHAASRLPRTADIGSMHRPNELVNIELVVPAICSRKDKHTDRETDTVIMILRLPIGGGVIIVQTGIGNESVPIQLAQCWFPRLAISNAKNINIFFK